ncbi:MAG: hypothetical protein VB144_01685 [Clostridia bacterium]|nr:hypothetical protein [Clostridia bacterium]
MPLDNCSRCGKLFNRVGRSICSECMQKEQDESERVLGYLRKHGDATIDEIADATGVDEKIILHLMRQDRVRVSPHSLGLHCRACGTQITSGAYCASCASKFRRELASTGAAGALDTRGVSDESGRARSALTRRDSEESGAHGSSAVRMVSPERRRDK